MGSILILTGKTDTHPNKVINLLNERKISFFRLNTEDLLIDYEFSWSHFPGEKPDFFIYDKLNGKTLRGEEIHSVWYRKPDFPKNFPYKNNAYIDIYNAEESRQFFIYLMHYLSDIYSIGNHFFDKRANSKMIQSRLAVDLGMSIAPTCMSNRIGDIINFANEFEEIGIKTFRAHWLRREDGKVYDLTTQKVASNLLKHQPAEAFSQAPVFLQQYIDKKYELRITVMGPYVFTCKLDSQAQTPETGAIDWRQGYDYGLRHEMIPTPPVLDDFCKKYLRKLNLNFGCFDFIVTPDEKFVFLECNPNGQWGWIEDECHEPMSEAMVDCLCNRLYV